MPPVRLKHRLEYAALSGVRMLVLVLPERAALAVGYVIAWVAFHWLRYRRREVLGRIYQVFGPDLDPSRARSIAWLSLRNLAFNAMELLRVGKFRPDAMQKRAEGFPRMVERIQEMVKRHGGLILAVPHMGNWDLAGVACLQAGIPLFSIAARQRNPLVNGMINQLRKTTGMVLLERGSGTMREVLRRLRSGGTLAILPDVRMRVPDLEVSFLGTQANIGRGMAQFAHAANVPILPVIIFRQGWRRLHFETQPPVLPDSGLDREENVRIMTQSVFNSLEAAIRKRPEQWFWYNRRWILEPVERKK